MDSNEYKTPLDEFIKNEFIKLGYDPKEGLHFAFFQLGYSRALNNVMDVNPELKQEVKLKFDYP